MPLAYAVADLHAPEAAGAGAWADLPGVAGDALYGLAQVVARAVQDGADLWLAGDNFDGPDPEPAAVAALYAVLRPQADAGGRVLYVLGNHDRGRDWLAPFGPAAVRLDGRVVDTPGGTVTGLSYTDPAGLSAALARVAVADVGVYHQMVAEWGPGGKGTPLAAFPSHRLAVIGDVHARAVLTPRTGPAVALSPGPLAPQSTAEFVAPQVWAVGADLTPAPVPLRGRRYERYEVDSADAADACLAALARIGPDPDPALPDGLRAPLAAVRLTAPVPGFVAAARRLATDRGFFLRVADAATGPRPGAAADPVAAGLAAAIAGWGAPAAVTALALAATAPGADPAAVLAADAVAA